MPSLRDFISSKAEPMANGPAKAGISRAVAVHQQFEVEAAKIRGNADLSAEGKRKALRGFLGSNAHELVRVGKLADRARTRSAEKRAKWAPPAPDKTDAAGAILRAQIRDRLAGKSLAELKATLPSAPLAYLQAVLEAPELVGADADLRDIVMNRAIDLAHPGASAAIKNDADAATLLGVASQALRDLVRDIAELPNDAALEAFINESVPDQRHIEADVERATEPLAAA